MPDTITAGAITADTPGPADPVSDGGRAETRRPALSPSRASDFKQCPLLYRFRAIDRLPERPTPAQLRGTVVHAVLERLYGLPAEHRLPQRARELVDPAWADVRAATAGLDDVFDDDDQQARWLESARDLVDAYFRLEDPRRLEPAACELRIEAELPSGLLLRGYIDRLDVAPTGEIRVVDYKTGAAPRAIAEFTAMFQMKFYALALLLTRGTVPRQLRLLYLADGEALNYAPDEAELRRFQATLSAIWEAILRAGRTGDFRPNPGRLCDWCVHQQRCPAFGGTPPPYPGWPGQPGDDGDGSSGAHRALDRTG